MDENMEAKRFRDLGLTGLIRSLQKCGQNSVAAFEIYTRHA